MRASERRARAEAEAAAVVFDGVPVDFGVLGALVAVLEEQADRSVEQPHASAADELPAENRVAARIVVAGEKAGVGVLDIDFYHSRAGADVGLPAIPRHV